MARLNVWAFALIAMGGFQVACAVKPTEYFGWWVHLAMALACFLQAIFEHERRAE